MSERPDPPVADLLRAWGDGRREMEIVEALYRIARGRNHGAAVQASKFLLANLWPRRWSMAPHPTKTSPLDDSSAADRAPPPAAETGDDGPTASTPPPPAAAPPFRMKIVG